MNISEVNKIIAEYMDEWVERHTSDHFEYEKLPKEYTKSLDALIPVWLKLEKEYNRVVWDYIAISLSLGKKDHAVWMASDGYDPSVDFIAEATTIQEAAAISAVKAIQALNL